MTLLRFLCSQFPLVRYINQLSKILLHIDDWSFHATIEMYAHWTKRMVFVWNIYISRRGMILEWTTCSQPCSQSCACAYIQIAIATYTMNLSINTLAISKSCNCLMWSWNAFNKILIWLIYWVFIHRKRSIVFGVFTSLSLSPSLTPYINVYDSEVVAKYSRRNREWSHCMW